MGRRRRGWYWAFIVRPADEHEAKFFTVGEGMVRPEDLIMFWTGRSPSGENWHDLMQVAHRFFLASDAEAEALLLVSRSPDYLGKVRVITRFIPEPKEKRRRRRDVGGSSKAVGDPVHGLEPGGDVPPRQGAE